MKRFAIAAAALTLVGPLATTAAYADPPGRYDHNGNGDNRDRNDRNDNRRDDNRYDNRRDDNRYDNRGQNGGWQNHRQWRRGDRMSFNEQSHYRAVDYRYAHLRAPPRGYHYVQDDRGQTLLLGIATGVILGVILNGQNDHYQGDRYNGRY